MWRLGLIGHPVAQSFSPQYFKAKFEELGLRDWDYQAFDLPHLDDFESWWQSQAGLVAVNVTIPHKQTVLACCKNLSDDVKAIGAANLIIQSEQDPLSFNAFNTDHSGFAKALKETWDYPFQKALILGSGGSSKAIQYALTQLNIPFEIGSRSTLGEHYQKLSLKAYDLIINCTPYGLPSQWEALPLPYDELGPQQHFFDLNYHGITPSMQKCLDHGAQACNGLSMLQHQADFAWELIKAKRSNCFQ